MAKLPTSGVTFSEVKSIVYPSQQGTNLSVLCKNGLINLWAKYKPFSAPFADAVTDDIRARYKWGLSIVSGVTAQIMADGVDEQGTGIKYVRPTGGTSSPYRLGDFRGYNSEAPIPVRPYFSGKSNVDIAKITGTTWLTTIPQEYNGSDATCLKRDEIYSGTDKNGNPYSFNHGVYIRNGTTARWSVGGIPFGNTAWQALRGKKCEVYEFYCNLPTGTTSSNHTQEMTDIFIACPGAPTSVTFTTTGSTAPTYSSHTMTVNVSQSDDEITATIRVSSVDTSTSTLTGCTFEDIQVLISEVKDGPAVGYIHFYDVVLGAEQTITLEDSTFIRDAGNSYYFRCSSKKEGLNQVYQLEDEGMVMLTITGGDIIRPF